MLSEYSFSNYFWVEALNMVSYVPNQVNFKKNLNKIINELLKGKNPNLSHLYVFECKHYVLNNGKRHSKKIDSKLNEGIFLGYTTIRRGYKITNMRTLLIKESIHILFNEFVIPLLISYPIKENTL